VSLWSSDLGDGLFAAYSFSFHDSDDLFLVISLFYTGDAFLASDLVHHARGHFLTDFLHFWFWICFWFCDFFGLLVKMPLPTLILLLKRILLLPLPNLLINLWLESTLLHLLLPLFLLLSLPPGFSLLLLTFQPFVKINLPEPGLRL
jgi:hypothetical protein